MNRSEPASAASSHLPVPVVGRQQGLSDRKPSRGAVSAATGSQEETQHAEPRAHPQPGLLAKGVRLLRNMGNQEAKQKKAASSGTAGDAHCEGDAEDRDVDKKSKKSHSKNKVESNGKKKGKSDSKSVFSNMKIKKTKGKRLSKEDILEDDKHLASSEIVASQSTDDIGVVSDCKVDNLAIDGNQSGVDENGRKTSSGSDVDLYSFHSAAADNEDLLSDIQQTIRQCAATEEILQMMTGHYSEGSTTKDRGEVTCSNNQDMQALCSTSVDVKTHKKAENDIPDRKSVV